MAVIKMANLGLAFMLEICAIAALGYWGFQVGGNGLLKYALGLGLPIVAIVVWGTFVAPKAAVTVPVPVHVLLKVVILGGAAALLYAAGRQSLGMVFAVVLVLNHILMAVWDQ